MLLRQLFEAILSLLRRVVHLRNHVGTLVQSILQLIPVHRLHLLLVLFVHEGLQVPQRVGEAEHLVLLLLEQQVRSLLLFEGRIDDLEIGVDLLLDHVKVHLLGVFA